MIRDESGTSTVEFMFGMFWLLVLSMGLLVATNWPSEVNAANAAAYEAARAMVEAPNADDGAELGRARAREVLFNHGYDTEVDVTYSLAGRGEAMEASVHITLPALRFPGMGTWDAIPWTATRSFRIPDYRSYD